MTSLATSSVLLAKSVVGAGTAGIPAVIAALGAPAGTVLLVALSAASAASTAVVLGAIRRGGGGRGASSSYTGAVLAILGPHTASLLDASSAAFGWGMLVVYCGMVADCLVGPAGLVCGAQTCPRPAAVAALAATTFLPLSLARSLSDSAGAAWAGAVAVLAWAGIGVGLVAWAALKGGGGAGLHALPTAPDPTRLATLGGWGGGGGGGGGASSSTPAPPPWRVAKGVATAAGTITSSLVTQLTAPPLAAGLAPPRTARREGALVWTALAGCVCAYLAVALPALALLGVDSVRSDVLEGWTAAALAPAAAVGGGGGAGPPSAPLPRLAVLAAAGVRASFAAALITMFPLMMWPTREAVGRLAGGAAGAWKRRRRGVGGGEGEGWEAPLLEGGGGGGGEGGDDVPDDAFLSRPGAFLTTTAALTLSAAAVAVAVPDAAASLALVGGGAGALVAFFIPAALCWAGGNAAGAAGLALVGCFMLGAVV